MTQKSFKFCPHCSTPLQDATVFGAVRRQCPSCHYVQFHDPKVAACAFAEQDQKVLLVKRGVEPEMGKWALPAGYVNYGEAPESAAIRETQEETGLLVAVTGLLDVMFYEQHHAVIVIIYRVKPLGGTLKAADDALAADWFGVDELPDVAFESSQRVLYDWTRRIKAD